MESDGEVCLVGIVLMNASAKCVRAIGQVAAATLIALLSASVWAQTVTFKPARTEKQPEPPKDPLGRNALRGAVIYFVSNIRRGRSEIAALYLNGPLSGALRGENSETLAQQLAAVLDRRLPARLDQISDEPEGSVPDPLRPNEDVIGTIITSRSHCNFCQYLPTPVVTFFSYPHSDASFRA
jgi:hypothetical protein